MSETKFTPGPWEADIEDVGTILHRAVIGPNGEYVADCDAHRLSGEETAANARLIAAAPDMFAALQLIRSRLDEVTCSHECAVLDAAIAKATAA